MNISNVPIWPKAHTSTTCHTLADPTQKYMIISNKEWRLHWRVGLSAIRNVRLLHLFLLSMQIVRASEQKDVIHFWPSHGRQHSNEKSVHTIGNVIILFFCLSHTLAITSRQQSHAYARKTHTHTHHTLKWLIIYLYSEKVRSETVTDMAANLHSNAHWIENNLLKVYLFPLFSVSSRS